MQHRIDPGKDVKPLELADDTEAHSSPAEPQGHVVKPAGGSETINLSDETMEPPSAPGPKNLHRIEPSSDNLAPLPLDSNSGTITGAPSISEMEAYSSRVESALKNGDTAAILGELLKEGLLLQRGCSLELGTVKARATLSSQAIISAAHVANDLSSIYPESESVLRTFASDVLRRLPAPPSQCSESQKVAALDRARATFIIASGAGLRDDDITIGGLSDDRKKDNLNKGEKKPLIERLSPEEKAARREEKLRRLKEGARGTSDSESTTPVSPDQEERVASDDASDIMQKEAAAKREWLNSIKPDNELHASYKNLSKEGRAAKAQDQAAFQLKVYTAASHLQDWMSKSLGFIGESTPESFQAESLSKHRKEHEGREALLGEFSKSLNELLKAVAKELKERHSSSAEAAELSHTINELTREKRSGIIHAEVSVSDEALRAAREARNKPAYSSDPFERAGEEPRVGGI